MRKLTAPEMRRLSPDEFRAARKLPLVIVLDDIRSQYNVGSVFRTADAFAIEKIVLCGITGTPPTTEIHKTALGAEDSVAWQYCASAADAVKALRASGYLVFAAEQCDRSTLLPVSEITPGAKYAVVLGNEVKGVRQEVIDICDGCIEIPQFGTKHSLNVSVAAGIVMWEFLRRLKF